ncbi:hypothetical protein [Massilia sp. Root335]|uniref:hypothetical protein n=1 Tax=Massilia sp. Root335 TaxID=1736517 RepID=UPI0006F236D2|nr:hypothetical protein [Massilia sp. Root335]KQV45190.1 hypothetical protein ASC93_01165 [Massilia sp. Root335]
MQNDAGTAPGTLDGSLARITALLRELIELTGHDERDVHALELRFGDILTRTALHAPDGNHLAIMAMLPPCGDGGYRTPHGQDMEFLWDADEGRYIGLRLVPIGSLRDERSVMDAILATADMAAAWLTARRLGA